MPKFGEFHVNEELLGRITKAKLLDDYCENKTPKNCKSISTEKTVEPKEPINSIPEWLEYIHIERQKDIARMIQEEEEITSRFQIEIE